MWQSFNGDIIFAGGSPQRKKTCLCAIKPVGIKFQCPHSIGKLSARICRFVQCTVKRGNNTVEAPTCLFLGTLQPTQGKIDPGLQALITRKGFLSFHHIICNLLRMHHQRSFCCQVFFLALNRRKLFKLSNCVNKKILICCSFCKCGTMVSKFHPGISQPDPGFADNAKWTLKSTEAIEKHPVPRLIKQAAFIMLTMDLNQ